MEKHLRVAEFIANLLDNQFKILNFRFGMNGILGLVPGIGDILSGALAAHLVWIGIQMELPRTKLVQMIWNVVVNFLIGLVPVVGDYADFFHKGNLKNLAILKEHAERNIIKGELIG